MSEYISQNALYNGCVLKSTVIKEEISSISNISDVCILNEVATILFAKAEMKSKEKELSKAYETKLRSLIVDYINQKNEL